MIEVVELIKNIYDGKNIPKRIEFAGEIFEKTFKYIDTPICFLYRNINDKDEFLFRDYSINLTDNVKINRIRKSKKVRCIETNKIFKSPASAGRYYGFSDGDMISKVCRNVHETAKGLHFEYIEK